MSESTPTQEFLSVPNRDSLEDFQKEAKRAWQDYHMAFDGTPGAPSKALEIFLATNAVGYQLYSRATQARIKHHDKMHGAVGKSKKRVSCDRCSECAKKPLRITKYKLGQEVEKFLPVDCDNRAKGEKPPDRSRTIARHIKTYVQMLRHPEWFRRGMPKKHQDKFNTGARMAFLRIYARMLSLSQDYPARVTDDDRTHHIDELYQDIWIRKNPPPFVDFSPLQAPR